MPRRRIAPGRLGRWLRGQVDLAGLLGLGRDDLDELAWQAYRRLRSGAIAEADRIFELLALLGPATAATAGLGRGACLQARGQLAEAEAAYDAVLAAEPENLYALANRAEVRLLGGRPDAARADLAAALARLDRLGGPADLRRRVERLQVLAEGPGP